MRARDRRGVEHDAGGAEHVVGDGRAQGGEALVQVLHRPRPGDGHDVLAAGEHSGQRELRERAPRVAGHQRQLLPQGGLAG